MKWLDRLLGRKTCEDDGCDYEDSDVIVRKRSFAVDEVVADFKAVKRVCRRCRRAGDMVIGEKIESYVGCTMPVDMWREIDRTGYVVLDGRDYASLRDDSREVRRF